ncbi:1-phosphatidylinositol 4,5-bisphosphate phosphodiesterase zeta-1-like [Amia ocellicauda]|uniref:1-phosphatidylinositol 4,5-bisphosphate phosphodiesterase zeta-1-like n=1 Tax=Amia ocellicauda TaxID=2972642 RepID=UPI00346498F6
MLPSMPPTSRRAEILHIYCCYAPVGMRMTMKSLLEFLHKEQMETHVTEGTVVAMIDKYEIDETARVKRSMTFEGFLRYMESKDCCVFNRDHLAVYQDMGQPLNHYFISSSHNTYLMGDQLIGKSQLFAYVSALRRGCRCLEIDCWDGPDHEPIVYHGHTLTSKIFFKDVIETVEHHAFMVSPYPVILSLENHCSHSQQEVMAQHLRSILGDKLLSTTINNTCPKELPSPQKKKIVVAMELSDLVIYTKSVKFISFSHSSEHQKCYENTSIGENKARKLVRNAGTEFVLHNMRFISRIYPAGTRAFSSNYNPQEFWNVGSQLVALNFQSTGLPMDLNTGKFRDNGGCGYVLKPSFMRINQKSFDPNSFQHDFKPVHLLVKVISGDNIPVPKTRKTIDPYVRVEIHGVPSDSCRKQTNTVKCTDANPRWDESLSFTIQVPDLALVRFTIKDHHIRSDFVGQYTLPFTSLKKGYRWVPLLSKEGFSLDPASLFIYIWYC